jgi:hypothetical protein
MWRRYYKTTWIKKKAADKEMLKDFQAIHNNKI